MSRTLLLVAYLWAGPLYAQPTKIGVRASQFITLEFPAEIVDLEVGSQSMYPRLKASTCYSKRGTKR